MFKFGFGSPRAKKRLRVPKGAYIFQGQELEKSVGGGTPVRQLLYPVSTPDWAYSATSGASTSIGVGEANYSRYTQVFPSSPWQSGMTWETTDGIKPLTGHYYDS